MDLMALQFVCPCCGYAGLKAPPYERMGLPPWGDHGEPPYCLRYGMPSYECCACCGFEFGNEDEAGGGAQGATFEEYRKEWIESGAPWFSPSLKSENWDLMEQLKRASLRGRW